MSYLTIEMKGGTSFEAKDMDDVYKYSHHSCLSFVEVLENKIKENNNTNKPPFDGIDFPDVSKILGNDWEKKILINRLNSSDIFINALKKQPKNDELKSALTFVSNLDLSNQIEGCGVKDFDGRRKDLLLQTISDRYLDSEFMPLSCMMWKNAYKCQFGRNYGGGSCDFGYKEDIANRVNAGERLEGSSAQALRFIFKEGEGYRYFSSDDLKTISPLLENSDLSRLSEKDKQHIETLMNGSKLNDYVEKSLVTNLSQEALLKRKNITLEDLQTYYGRNIERSSLELYGFACKAGKDNEAMNKVRGELAIKITNENIANGKYNDSNVRLDVGEEDLLRGYKDNPEALRALGVKLPVQIVDLVKDDEQLKKDVQFIDGARHLYGLQGQEQTFEKELNLLNQIAEKGFEAGYGAELTLLTMGKVLDEQRAKYESSKYNLEIKLPKRDKYEQVSERYNVLSEIRNDSWNLDDLKEIGLTRDDILRMAIDKTLGKEVKKMECTDKPTDGFKGMFMGKKAKAEELAEIAAKQEACERVNMFVEKFSHKYRNYNNFEVVKYPENNPKALLAQYSTIEEIKKQVNEDVQYKEANKFDPHYFSESEDKRNVERFEKIEAVYRAAQEKVEYQANIARTAYETSGVKDMEANTGFDAMAVKAELLKENPELSVRDLYAKVKEIRDRGEYTSEVKIRESKPDKVVSTSENKSDVKEKQVETMVEPKKDKTMEFRADTPIKAEVLTASVEEVMKMVQSEKTTEVRQDIQEEKKAPEGEKEVKSIHATFDKGHGLPEGLSSKEPQIQKAIDMIRGGTYQDMDALKASEEYNALPKYAKDCAGKLYYAAHNDVSSKTTNHNFAKLTVKGAEKTAKELVTKTRGLGKTPANAVKKTTISNEAIMSKKLSRE